MQLNAFDMIVLSIIALSAVLGTYRGMIGLVIGFFAFMLSIICAYFLYFPFFLVIKMYVASGLVSSCVSVICAYFLSLFGIGLISSKCNSYFHHKGIGNMLAGMMLGLLRGAIFCWIIFLFIAVVASDQYSNASNALEVIEDLDTDKYPAWLKSAKTFHALQALHNNVSENVLPRQFLQNISLQNEQNVYKMYNKYKNETKCTDSEDIKKTENNQDLENLEILIQEEIKKIDH